MVLQTIEIKKQTRFLFFSLCICVFCSRIVLEILFVIFVWYEWRWGVILPAPIHNSANSKINISFNKMLLKWLNTTAKRMKSVSERQRKMHTKSFTYEFNKIKFGFFAPDRGINFSIDRGSDNIFVSRGERWLSEHKKNELFIH